MASADQQERTVLMVVIGVLAALCIVFLLGWARGAPGDDGRAPDPEDVHVVVVEPVSNEAE
jgi:hypothetical protein